MHFHISITKINSQPPSHAFPYGIIQKLRNKLRVGGGLPFCDSLLRLFEGRGGGLRPLLRNKVKFLKSAYFVIIAVLKKTISPQFQRVPILSCLKCPFIYLFIHSNMEIEKIILVCKLETIFRNNFSSSNCELKFEEIWVDITAPCVDMRFSFYDIAAPCVEGTWAIGAKGVWN